MRRKFLFSAGVIVIFIVIILIVLNVLSGNNKLAYQFAEITRGKLENTISSTGTINPVSKVEVGTQVSGIIDRVYVDFNDTVSKGQLLALLDTIPLKISVLDAEANVEKIKAQLEQAQQEFDRNYSMFEKALISDADFLPFRYNLKMQQAALKSAAVNLQRAKRNLKYAFITSPIQGTVIQRNVEAGQTVAASLQAPTLFIIAENLSKMEIHAQVDESDIGQIREDQKVRFDVTTYPDQKFTGIVRQIRLQPEVVSNVVNYTVVIDADNEQNLLLPGMTANVDFITDERKNVLLIPNTALRFQPPEEFQNKLRKDPEREGKSLPDSVRANFRSRIGEDTGSEAGNMRSSRNFRTAWYLDDQGKLAMAMLQTGISDGTRTEVVHSRILQEGMQVIISMGEKKANNNADDDRGPQFGRRSRPF
ncbi:MAG: efflux RND transporter periplasmic adaptor subunit [bacterium]|nr:MAG: efflux RND transporter periplasmic adaptor subunit [bacterium]